MKRIEALLLDKKYQLIFVFSVAAILLFARLREGSLGGYDDAFFALKGRQILRTGTWWTATVESYPYVQPLFIWLEAISFAMFGTSDFAARFFPAVAGLATIAIVYLLAANLSKASPDAAKWGPIFAVVILITTHQFTKYARHAMSDIPFVFFTTAALFFYWKGLKSPVYFLLFGALTGLAILTRSIMGLIPLAVAGVHFVLTGHWRRLCSGYFVSAVVLASLLTASWYIPNFLTKGVPFLEHQFSFIRDKAQGAQQESLGSSLGYFKLMAAYYWPWLPFLVVGFLIAAKKAVRGRDPRAIFLLVWIGVVVLPLSFAETKALRYLLPAFPAFSLLAALSLTNGLSEAAKIKSLKVIFVGLFLYGMAYAFLPMKLHLDRSPHIKALAPVARQETLPGEALYLYLGGSYHGDRMYELIWYADRPVQLLREASQVKSLLSQAQRNVIVLDRASFDRLLANGPHRYKFLHDAGDLVCISTVH